MIDKAEAFADAYPAAYQTLYQAKPITCSIKGTMFDAVPAPCVVIVDVSVRDSDQQFVNNAVLFYSTFSPFLSLYCMLREP